MIVGTTKDRLALGAYRLPFDLRRQYTAGQEGVGGGGGGGGGECSRGKGEGVTSCTYDCLLASKDRISIMADYVFWLAQLRVYLH